jgi:DNA-binding NarL/FixJ family response regulator
MTTSVTTTTVRVVIVDDHELIRTDLREVLDGDPAIRVVAEASNGDHALAAVEFHRPDVVVMDLQMPGMGGIEATRRILRCHPLTAVLVPTMFDDDDSVFAAIRSGARGYLLKGAPRAELRASVHGIALGQAIFGPGVASRMLDLLQHGHAAQPSLFPSLTPRELDTLEALVDNHDVSAIAARLEITPKTVRNNIASVLTKLHVSDRAMAIDLARHAGIGRRRDAQLRTLLFVELDNPSAVAHTVGHAYANIVTDFAALVADIVRRRGGHPFGYDSTTPRAWFTDTEPAIRAALNIGRAVQTHDFPTGHAIRACIGIHRGATTDNGSEVLGLAIHETARVVAHCHPGQIVITNEAAPDMHSDSYELVELGCHDLEDIDRSLQLFRLNERPMS